MMATVPHVISGLGLRKFQADGFLLTFQADGFLLTRVYLHALRRVAGVSPRCAFTRAVY